MVISQTSGFWLFIACALYYQIEVHLLLGYVSDMVFGSIGIQVVSNVIQVTPVAERNIIGFTEPIIVFSRLSRAWGWLLSQVAIVVIRHVRAVERRTGKARFSTIRGNQFPTWVCQCVLRVCILVRSFIVALCYFLPRRWVCY